MTRTFAPLALTLALLAGTTSAQEAGMPPPNDTPQRETVERDAAAVAILEAARDALAERKTIAMTVHSAIEAESGPLASFSLGADGAAWMTRGENNRWIRAMVGEADDIGTTDRISFTVIKSDGKASWVDNEKQEVVHAIGRHAKGKVYGSAELFGLDKLFAGNPYARELSAQKLEVLPAEPIDGVLCDVVRVEYPGRDLPTRWYIASGDGFPRRIVEELMPGADRVFDYSDVVIDEPIDESRFKIEVPPGYVEKNLPPSIAATPNQPASTVKPEPANADGVFFGTGVGDLAVDFSAETIFGEPYTLSDLRGKPAVVIFWASWAPNAQDTAKEIAEIQDFIGDKGGLLTLAVRERQPEAVVNMLLDMGRDDVVVLTSGNQVANTYKVARVPVVLILDKDGRIVFREERYKNGKTIEEIKSKLTEMFGD
ncbi:MAG TPA: TlpA family protein disulfide reductase [Phycisphaerales bacterium]|nr:TlpA family protein disulfide reductase [Phycisphaerales bacterium]